MKSECLLLSSQESTIGPYNGWDMNQVPTLPLSFFKIPLNIILSSVPGSLGGHSSDFLTKILYLLLM
jgi:hypothetical protein